MSHKNIQANLQVINCPNKIQYSLNEGTEIQTLKNITLTMSKIHKFYYV